MYLTHDDWNNAVYDFKPLGLDDETVSAFLDELCAGEFVYTWETDPDSYDSALQGHLFFPQSDGTTVEPVSYTHLDVYKRQTYACDLPDDLLSKPEGYRLPLVLLKDNMLKNHGYSRDIHNGVQTGIVTCDTGVFRFTPPAERGGEWTIETLITDAASDAVMVDFDGDGEKELLTLSPFHGDTLRIYKKSGSGYVPVFEYAKKIEFAHAICGCTICRCV